MRIFRNIKEGYNTVLENIRSLKEDSTFWRVALNKYVLVFLVFLMCICFFDRNSAGVLVQTERTLHQQDEYIMALEEEISTLEQRINKLSSQKDTLEQFAREEYMFHEKDEDIFLSN